MQQYADIYCKVTLHVSGVTAPETCKVTLQ